MTPEIKSFVEVYVNNREKQKESYKERYKEQGYNFYLKTPGKKYYNEAEEIQRFCFEKYKEGRKQHEIAAMLGLKNSSTVSYHIKKFTQSSKNRKLITS